MTHYRAYRLGYARFISVEDAQTHYTINTLGLNVVVGREVSISPHTEPTLGLSVETGAFRVLPEVGISEGLGFTVETGDVGFNFQNKLFGTLQNSYENGTLTDTPDLSDYWVSFIPNEGLYWDDNLDTSDLELIVVFRIDETDFSSLSTSHDVVFKSGDTNNGFAVSYYKRSDGQPYLAVSGELSGVVTSIEINLKNVDLDTGVWYELYATSAKIIFREYDTPSNSFSVAGSIDFGYADYYESIGFSHGGSVVVGTTGGYARCSVRSINYYHAGKIDMPADVNLYPFWFYCRFGTNHEGSAGRVSEGGTPTIGTEWVTFDGNDAYHWGTNTLQQVDDIDIKITFRLEEDHLDTLDGKYTIWKIGDQTDGFELLIVDRDFYFASRNNGTLKQNKLRVYNNLEMDVWYEAFLSDSKITIREEATPANGFTQSATVDVNATPVDNFYMGLAADVGGYIYDGGYGSWQDYTQMSCKELVLHRKGGLTFPSDLSAPLVGPIYRWNWGSSVGGTYGWNQGGAPTINTDNIEGDGDDGLYDGAGYYPKPSTGWGIVVEFQADSFASAATIWKTGDEANGAEIGIDGSGNIGFYGRSSSTLTSMTVATSVLSTATTYFIYTTDSNLKIYDSALSLVAETTGTVTSADSSGTQDSQCVLVSVYGSPMTGASSTWQQYLDGRIYTLEIWEEDEFIFPPSNWHHAEGEIGFADEIDGNVNTAIEEATSEIGFAEEIGGELISHVTGTSEGIGFTDEVNVLSSDTFFSEATIGFNETVVGEQRATHEESASTLGFTEETGADHIDESSGEVDSTIGFNDVTDAYNATIRKEASSTLGLNETIGGHLTIKNVGIAETLGLNALVEAYNSFFYKEVAATLGLNGEAFGKNIISRAEVLSTLGLTDTIDGANSIHTVGISEGFGLSDNIDANIIEIEGISVNLGFSDAIDGHATTRNVGFSSQFGLNGAVLGGNPLNPDNEGEIGFSDEVGATHYPVKGFSAILGLDDEAIPVRQYDKGVESTLGFNDSGVAENAGNLLIEIPANVTYKFYLTLTGANDSLDDYEIERLKTIQFRMKSGTESSYLGITAMYSEAAETAIDARPNGTLVLEMASVYEGVEVLREDLMEVGFSDVRYDLGSSSQSISINGYGALTYDSDVVFLANATSKKTAQDGRITYRFARPNFYLRPGYKVVYGLENFTADEISFYVGENKFYMDVYFDSSTLSGLNANDIYQRYALSTDRERQFFVTLTGSQDSTDDYIFSGIIDIQVRLSFGKRSYASVKVLHSQEVQDAIVARPNGDIVIEVIDGVGGSLTEFVTVNFNDVSYDLLPMSRTATLVGYKTIQFISGTVYTPIEVVAKGVDGGGFANVRTNAPNLSVTPGYNVVYDGLDFVAGEVNFNFQQFSQQMTIRDTITITTENPSDTTLGLLGEAVSNTFYRSNSSESELGLTGQPHVSFNAVENAYHDTCGIGFTEFIGYELNPET